MFKNFLLDAAILLCVLCITAKALFNSTNSPLTRFRRYLVYPELTANVPKGRRRQHSRVEFRIGVGVPVELDPGELEVASELKAEYELPTSAAELRGEISEGEGEGAETGREERGIFIYANRRHVYSLLENILNRFGADGKSCVLRMICEAAQLPVETGWNLASEIIHLILTIVYFSPSATEDGLTNVSEYGGAERLGRQDDSDCFALYPECKSNMLSYISKFY